MMCSIPVVVVEGDDRKDAVGLLSTAVGRKRDKRLLDSSTFVRLYKTLYYRKNNSKLLGFT